MRTHATVHRATASVRSRAPARPAAPASVVSGESQRASVRSIIGHVAQFKLDISRPGDTHEHEADRVADLVMRQESDLEDEEENLTPVEGEQVSPKLVQRQEQEPEEEKDEERPVEEVARAMVQRQEATEEVEEEGGAPPAQPGEADPSIDVASAAEGDPQPLPEPDADELELMSHIQGKSAARGPPADFATADGPLAQRISSPPGGSAVPTRVLSRVEPHLGADLSHVRVHSSVQDRSDAVRLQARAFTYRNHVFLGAGERSDDVQLMSHELTHVVQQGAAIHRQQPRAPPAPVSVVGERVQRGVGDWILQGVAELANNIPGFSLLTLFLGRNPITDEPVPRTAINVTRAVLGLLGPVGEAIFQNLQSSGALERAYAWLSDEIAALGITWNYVKALFRQAWDSIGITDGVSGAWEKIKAIFSPPLSRILSFAGRVVGKIKEFIIQGVLSSFGETGQRVASVITQARDAFDLIVSDPIGFVKNLVGAVSRGFTQFSDNIVDHLKKGFMAWLFGTLSSAGLELPDKLDLKGILSIVLQVLGLTYGNIRTRLVKALGESRVKWIETAFEFVRLIATQGLGAAWQKIVETIGDLKVMVIDAIKNWIIEKVVMSAVTKLIGMFFPAAAVIEAIKAIYNTVVFFIERAQQILALVESVIGSIGAIARGQTDAAANFVEQAMGRTIPVIIGFLARLVGLGDIADKIRKFITDIQARVGSAIDKVVNAIVEKAKALLAAGKAAAVGAVAAVKDWWTARRQFKVDGEDHELFFEGSGESAALKVASPSKQPVDQFLDSVSTRLEGDRAVTHKEALALYGKIEARRQRINKARSEETPAETIALEADMKELGDRLALLMQSQATAHGETVFTVREVNSDGLGLSAVADPLTREGAEGSVPSVGNPVWDAVNMRRFSSSSDASYYIRGHLINHNVHGPGNRAWNLTPITRDANKSHLTDIETDVKTAVIDKGKALRYEVKAVYPRSTKLNVDSLVARAEGEGFTDGQRKTVRKILEAENKLPDRLEARAVILEPGPDGKYVNSDEKFVPGGTVTIKNDLPTDLPPKQYTPES